MLVSAARRNELKSANRRSLSTARTPIYFSIRETWPTSHLRSMRWRQSFTAMWTLGPDQIHELPLIAGDSSGAATAINDNGQIVGISGICDQAVGRRTAKHAVLWQNGTVTDIYPNAAAPWWNTPTAINQRGDVVGFAGDPDFVEGDVLHAFMWTREDGIRQLKPLPHRTPKHDHGGHVCR